MASDDEFVERIMHRAALVIGEGPSDPDADRHREGVVTTATYAVNRRRRRLLVGGIATLLAVTGAAILTWQLTAHDMAFWMGSPPTLGREGDAIDASVRDSLPVAFADASRLDLLRGARARIVTSHHDRVEALLETGVARVDIKDHAKASWLISVGPFRVRTIGAAFTVDWQPSTGALRIDVHRGSVAVTDTEQDRRTYDVVSGKRLQISRPRE
jgi:ferric-dicitrate binding protein FerR (iron transport regulator)